jgi:F-type H+-transporting ATPase subunit delta
MRETRISHRYAKALLETAEQLQALNNVKEDAEGLISLVRANPEFHAFLNSPVMRYDYKADTFRKLFEGKVHSITLNFLLILANNRREKLLLDILLEFQNMVDKKEGIETAKILSSIKLSNDEINKIKNKLETFSNKKVRVETMVDENLQGGLLVRIGDKVFDGTVKRQLQVLKEQLKQEELR